MANQERRQGDRKGNGPKHKMNKHWQAAADEASKLIPGGDAEAIAGVQDMYDAIEDAGTNPDARLQAALGSFACNTTNLAAAIKQTGTPVREGAAMAKKLLGHTLKHFDEIEHSVLNGHKKD